jgi:hypothetical protein
MPHLHPFGGRAPNHIRFCVQYFNECREQKNTMIHATDADSLRALLKDEYSDYADTSAEWKQQAITYLTLRGAEATLQELCGQQVTLARLLTMVSRAGLGSVVECLEERINLYASGNEMGAIRSLEPVERTRKQYEDWKSLAEAFERHGIIRVDPIEEDGRTLFRLTIMDRPSGGSAARNRVLEDNQEQAGPTSQVSVHFVGDGTRALTGSRDASMTLWDLERGLPIRTFRGHTDAIWSIATSADGRRALSGSGDATLRLWDVDSGACLRVFAGHAGPLRSVALSADGTRAVSGAHDTTMRLWDAASGECLSHFAFYQGSRVSHAVPIAIDANRALPRAAGLTYGVVDLASGRCQTRIRFEEQVIDYTAISADGRRALACHSTGTDLEPIDRLALWDLDRLTLVHMFDLFDGQVPGWNVPRIECLVMDPTGTYVAAGYDDGAIRLWDCASGAFHGTIEAHDDDLHSIAFSKDARRMLSTGRDNAIKLWDPRTGEHLGTFGDGAINCEDVVRAGWFGHAPDTPAVRRMHVDVPPADNGTKTTSPIVTLALPA